MARETKLDDLVEKRICDALREGHSYAAAARAGGVDEHTVHNWRARGRAGDERFVQFLQRVERADQEAEDRCIQVLKSAITGDDPKLATDTAKWWLGRRRPAQWAELKGEAPPTEDECRELVAKIQKTGT